MSIKLVPLLTNNNFFTCRKALHRWVTSVTDLGIPNAFVETLLNSLLYLMKLLKVDISKI